MNYGITLTIEGKAINILRFSIEYFHPSHYDPALMDDATLAFYKKLGVVNREYEPPTHLTLDDLNRNLSYYRFKPCAEPLDGRFRITLESTGDEDLFYSGLKTAKYMHGVFKFFRAKDDDVPFRTIEFWDTFVSEIREEMAQDGKPMLLHLVLSPATVRFNKSIVFQKNWFVTDIDKKPEKTEDNKEEKTLVQAVTGEKEALPNQKIEYRVTRYNKSDASDADRKNVRWAVKIDGKQEELKDKKGEKITLEIEPEWAGKEIIVMACLDSFNENVSRKTKVVKWDLPKYFAKSKREPGYEEDGSVSPDMTYLDMTSEDVIKINKLFKIQIAASDKALYEDMQNLTSITSISSISGWKNSKKLIQHFMSNLGTEFSSPFLDKALATHSSLQKFLYDKNGVIDILKAQLKDKNGNINKIENEQEEAIESYRVKFNNKEDYFNGKKIAVDDTHSFRIYIEDYELFKDNKFSAALRIEIYDHFGLDKEDVKKFGYLAGFRAWFVLQHIRGYKPFITKMIYRFKINDKF